MVNNSPLTSIPFSPRKIGKVRGLHGLKGELFIYVFSKDVTWISQITELLLEDSKGIRHLYPVVSLREFKEGFLVFVEGIKDRTEAEKLRGCLVYVDSDIFQSEEGDPSFYLAEIEAFKVFDGDKEIGVIEGFGTNSAQDLLLVQTHFGVVQIPLVEDFLVEIDFENQKVMMTLPEGLIDVQKPSE